VVDCGALIRCKTVPLGLYLCVNQPWRRQTLVLIFAPLGGIEGLASGLINVISNFRGERCQEWDLA
jgi:hypothetical protein